MRPFLRLGIEKPPVQRLCPAERGRSTRGTKGHLCLLCPFLCFLCSFPFPAASESQSDGCFEEASLIALVLDRSEWRIPVDVQERVRRRRVVEDVCRIHSD